MKIEAETYQKLPEHLKALFQQAPNPSREEVLAGFPTSASPWIGNPNTGAKGGKMFGGSEQAISEKPEYRDAGSAARFFYCAKASKRDRCDGLAHIKARHPAEKTGRKEGSVGLVGDAGNRGQTANPYANGGAVARNHHPTVKPTDLMRYLCRLVTPPNGVVLDPFMGSGSTGRGALLEGFRFIGIEREAEYMGIANARVSSAMETVKKSQQQTEFELDAA